MNSPTSPFSLERSASDASIKSLNFQKNSNNVKKNMMKIKQLFMAIPITNLKDPQDFSDIVFMDSPEIFQEQDLIPLHEELVSTKLLIEDNPIPERVSFRIATIGNSPILQCEKAIQLLCQQFDFLNDPPYTLYYLTEKQSKLRIEVPPEEYIDNLLPLYDEWCILSSNKTLHIDVHLGNSNEKYNLEYKKNMSVKEAIHRIASIFELSYPEKYNLFINSNDAYWLDGNNALSQYTFKPDQRIEIHNASEQVFIRVHVPELETRFVVKTLINVKTKELISLISFNLVAKNLSLNFEPSNYSCFLPKTQIWMFDEDPLHFHLDSLAVRDAEDCGVEYKQRTAMLKVYSSSSKVRYDIHCLVKNKVSDVLQLLLLDNPNAFQCPPVLASMAGDEFKDTDTITDVLRHISSPSDFLLKSESKTIQITTSMDKTQGSISITLEASQTLKALRPIFSRRLGIKNSLLREFYFNHSPLDTLPEDIPLYQFRLDTPGFLLVVGVKSEEFKNESVELTKLWFSSQNEHTPYWCEGPDHPSNIIYDETREIVAASLNKLIEKITPEVIKDFDQYTSLLQTFFWTYPSFTTTAVLFKKLKERYFIPRFCHQSLLEYDKLRMSIQSRVCNLLKSWTKDSSFLNPSGKALIQEILTFTQHIMGPDRQHVIGKQIRKNLMKLRTHDHPKIPLANLEISSSFVNPQGLFQSPPFKVAKEFCNYMFHIYAAISPAELLNQRWMKTGALENAPNVTLLSQKFNNLARWFIKSILIIKDLQQRASRMEWIVEVASYLFEHKNFIVLMSALAGLGNSSVSRLKYTKARMAGRYRKKLEELEEVMDPKNSYKAYRASLREPKQDGTVSRIPYLAVHLSDLVYVEDGNPDQIQRLTNFAKRKLMYTVINEILQHQSSPYNFEPSSNVLQRWVTHCFNYTADQKEEELFKISLLLEPRGWDGVSPFPEKEATKSS